MTRSRITGKLRIGVTTIASPGSKSESRVMHINRGRPLISAPGAALGGLAVPADRQVAGLGGLDPVDGVEHDLALGDLHGVVAQLPAVGEFCRISGKRVSSE